MSTASQITARIARDTTCLVPAETMLLAHAIAAAAGGVLDGSWWVFSDGSRLLIA